MNCLEIARLPRLDFACTESMNSLATNLFYCGEDVKTIMITSRYAEEGKSFVTMNLLRTIASLQKRVILLDTDLRRSRLVSQYRIRFQNDTPFGLTHYLAGRCDLEDIIYQTNIADAYLIPIGREVESSLQLLSSSRMPALMEKLENEFDIILVDTPPAGVIVDALEIAKYCSGALIVVSCNRGRKQDIADVTNAIKNTGCPVLGAVLNNVEFGSYTNRKYYYKSERYASYYHGSYKPYSSKV
ncbi:MAG: CpsD/CapB family tyrosine-protein kinase [Clostridia bacterium]|nr:CpsD/CapB family tyrosine-protein kinase [Clostridia bacterium]